MDLKVNIKKKLQGFTLNVNFEAGTDIAGLLGASGSGKSMTLRCIAGLETPDSGSIVLNGRVLYDSGRGINLPSRKRKVGFLFQNYALFPHMNVEENIGFGLAGLSLYEKKQKIGEIISRFHLEGLEKRYPNQLSGGQQQRAALARALVTEPEVLLLDEPFSALDEFLRGSMTKQLIDTLADFKGVTLFVTHNMEEAYRICRNLIVLSEGLITASGHREDIFTSPPTLAAARLTGCKNISPARKISHEMVEAEEWGCRLKVRNAGYDAAYVGIRAHYISEANEGEQENVFMCWPSYTSETQFRVTVYLMLGRSPVNRTDFHIQWEVSKERWDTLKDRPLPWKICLRPDKLILIGKE